MDLRWQENKSDIVAIIDSEDIYNGLSINLTQTEHFANSRLLFSCKIIFPETIIYQLEIAFVSAFYGALNYFSY